MIGLDTNIIIRYLTQDDVKQSKLVRKFFEKELADQQGFVTLVTLVEVVWILESCYEQPKSVIIHTLESLLSTTQFAFENSEIIHIAINRFRKGNADFNDAIIAVITEKAGCEKVITFDKKSRSVGMTLLS